MKKFITTSTLAAAAFVIGTAASATTIDFTADAAGTTTLSGSEGPGWILSSNPADSITNLGSAHPNCDVSGLACNNDGFGVGQSDEITNNGVLESITITFTHAVTLTAVHFLDMFVSDGEETEAGHVTIGGTAGDIDASIAATASSGPGYKLLDGLTLTGTTFTFWASAGNDDAGDADVALAAIEIAPIPLPAGALLMGTALAGFGFMRRRR
jgi:hypothetical protein